MPKKTLVTCAIIENPTQRGKYLITQRPGDTHLALKWEFPGGKPEEGEDSQQALEREMLEETGIKVKAIRSLGTNPHSYEDRNIVLEAWICDFISGEIQKLGINDYAWKTPEEMRDYDMAEADLPFVEKLRQISNSPTQ